MKPCVKLLKNGKRCLIRSYEPKDYRQVRAVLESPKPAHFEKTWDSRQSLALMVKQDPESVLVAEADGQIVGTLYIHTHGHWAWFWRFVVAEAYQGLGVAQKLTDAALANLKKRGIPKVGAFIDGADKRAKALLRYYRINGWQVEEQPSFAIWRRV